MEGSDDDDKGREVGVYGGGKVMMMIMAEKGGVNGGEVRW